VLNRRRGERREERGERREGRGEKGEEREGKVGGHPCPRRLD